MTQNENSIGGRTMDSADFDALVRSWSIKTRRASLRWLVGIGLAAVPARPGPEEAGAKKKGKKKKKPKKDECENSCPENFFCCPGGSRCCPATGLPICCPFGCCPADPFIACGPDYSRPCVNIYVA
jgi:hypothetical protein